MTSVSNNVTLNMGSGSFISAKDPGHHVAPNFFFQKVEKRQKDGFSMADYRISQPSPQFLQGMNCFFTLNMDPNRIDYSNRPKMQFPNVVRMFKQCIQLDLCEKVVIFHEYSLKDKLHFHGQLKLKMTENPNGKAYTPYQIKFLDQKKLHTLESEIVKNFSQYASNSACIQFSMIRNRKSRDKTYAYCTKENHNKEHCLWFNTFHDLDKITRSTFR